MPTRIYDLELERELIALRDARGGNHHDEVWDGVYVMAPMPNDEHQLLVSKLTYVLEESIGNQQLGEVRPGVNVSDREIDWRQNYRVPDVALFLNGCSAKNCDSFWLGGPDLAIEIVSVGEDLFEKLDFYHAVHTRELIVIDRYPWSIQQYVREQGGMVLSGKATPDQAESVIKCKTVAFDLSVLPGEPRPQVRVTSRSSQSTWLF